jgi:hypothetical protein
MEKVMEEFRLKKTIMNGIERIAAERKRQIEEEGWTAEHDDAFAMDQLARAATCYAMPGFFAKKLLNDGLGRWVSLIELFWPWEKHWWKPTPENRIRELEKAGALIAAEIDRLLRI